MAAKYIYYNSLLKIAVLSNTAVIAVHYSYYFGLKF